MEVTRWQRRFHSNQKTGHSHLDLLIPASLDPRGTPPPPTLSLPPTLPSTPSSNWLEGPTPFLATLEPHLPFPQGNNIVVTLHRLNEAGEGLADKVLLEWALDVLRSLEDWRWL